MEAMNSLNDHLNTLAMLLIITAVRKFLHVLTVECTVREVFSKFNFLKGPGLLQFWACNTSSKSEDIGCNLILKQQTYRLNGDPQGLLQDYRSKCLENNYPFVGIETQVGNWLAGRVVQTRIADHRTTYRVLNQEDQHSADVGNLGQLVLPVFFGQGAGKKLVGIIEFVTPVAKESYIDDFEQIHSLLKELGLNSKYMGKTIKVEYDDDLIKFTLPLSAQVSDLHRKVTKRFTELEHGNFRVEYDDTEGNRLPISNDEDLRVCMAESSLRGAKFIRMRVLLGKS